MRAIAQDVYGEAGDVLRLAEIEPPRPGKDEVLLRVRAAGVDRGTWHMVAGMPYLIRFVGFGVRGPKNRVPGLDVAGTITALGSEVTRFAVGDVVYGTAHGSFAEFATASVTKLAPKPSNLSFEQAAAVPVSGLTALHAVRKAEVAAGQRVLIIGASGGVGTYAVQIAKARGAEVTGVCSTSKTDLVRSVGADHVIDYTHEDFADGTHHYDVILDIGGHSALARLRRALTRTGTLVIIGGETGGRWIGGFDRVIRAVLFSPFVSQKLTTIASTENAEDLIVLTEMIEAGQVVPTVDRTYPLAEAATAIRSMLDGRVRGKLVITVDSDG